MNPYESPRLVAEAQARLAREAERPQLWRVVGRWTLVCVVSALPSFFWGCSLHHDAIHLQAMLAGIATFVLLYTLAECSPLYQRLIRAPFVRRTCLIGYGTRLAISLVFPVGLTVDMFVGIVSVSLVEGAMLQVGAEQVSGLAQAGFLPVYLTTVVQGVLLNLVLLGYMLVVYAVLWGLSPLRRERLATAR